jgi:hypothetical protein
MDIEESRGGMAKPYPAPGFFTSATFPVHPVK